MALLRAVPPSGALRQDSGQRLGDYLQGVVDGFAGSTFERDVLAEAMADAKRKVREKTASRNDKDFAMIYPPANRMVVQYLLDQSKRPRVAISLWAVLLEHVRDEDEIMLTREGMAARVGASLRSIDEVLSDLVELRALRRERVPEPGKRGRGTVRWFMNSRVATRRKRGDRDAAYKAADRLKLVALDGGASSSERRSRAALPPPQAL